jgi:hypothetical protein
LDHSTSDIRSAVPARRIQINDDNPHLIRTRRLPAQIQIRGRTNSKGSVWSRSGVERSGSIPDFGKLERSGSIFYLVPE